MPPSSHKPPIAFLSRQSFLGTSPDNDSGSTEPELQPKLSKAARKKLARNAAKPVFDDDQTDKFIETHVTEIEPPAEDPPPPIPTVVPTSSLLDQIPHSFSKPQQISAPVSLGERWGDEKVSDQATPPYDDFLNEEQQSRSIPDESVAVGKFDNSSAVQPGFSTRHNFNSKSPPISPPQRYARPASYGGSIPPVPSTSRMPYRAHSRPQSQYGSPPAPHMPQSHFYNAQDIDIPMPGHPSGVELQEPTLVKHTSIANSSGECRAGILVGYHGRISLLATGRGKSEEVGAIADLPGMVVDALLLPTTVAKQDRLIALVLHCERIVDDAVEQVEKVQGMAGYTPAATTTTEFSTSVQVYSLNRQQHIATILESQPVHLQSYRGLPLDPPPPMGSLRLLADGKHLLIASGTSGEVFVVAVTASLRIECLGKLWTTIQPQPKRRDSSHGRSLDTDISPADLNRGLIAEERAIIDLNGRWLALCPASLPSRPSLNVRFGPGIICRSHAGIESITAPSQASLSCEVDSPDADSILGKVARGVAQEFVKGAKWLGDQGYQTWQNYWKKDQSPPTSLPQQQPYSSPTFPAQRMSNAFPPTHADALPMSKEPELVSIYDLSSLHETSGKRKTDELRPVATFQPPRGCSFLSFAPNGLNLLTAGRKGDVQYVWDLLQIHFCRAFVTTAEDDRIRSVPRVRQIARFERLSGSTIIDVSWEAPGGTRLAILTRNRTVHIFDLPSSSLLWPPPRGPRKARQPTKSIDNSIGLQDNNQSGFFASAMNIASKAQPMVSGWRGRAPSMGGGLAGIGQTGIGIATATGARSSKAVAVGLSRSFGAASETVSQIRHAGESRLHIKSHHEPTPGKMFWHVRGQEVGLNILDMESMRWYRIRKTKPQDRGQKESSSVFDNRKAPAIKLPRSVELRQLSGSHADNAGRIYPGFCLLDGNAKPLAQSLPHPLSYAEIETNAPYQPFHSDRRVTLCVFAASSSNTASELGQQWVFGDDVPLHRVNLARVQVTDDEDGHDSIIYRETTMSTDVGHDGMEHIVSTTRRAKKKKKMTGTAAQPEDENVKDDFFEDDCEVLDFATDRV